VDVTAFKQSDAKQQVKQKASQAKSATQETGFVQRLSTAQEDVNSRVTSWKRLLVTGLAVGVTFGSFIQISHNNGYLPKYDLWEFHIGSAVESGLIPFLLAPIWVLYSYLQPLADAYNGDDEATAAASRRAEPLAYHLLLWGVITAEFLLSSWLYLNEYPHWQCSAILAVLSGAIWQAFDKTKQGAVLGAVLLVGAPLTESFIVNVLHLWHYERPDFLGVPHWAGWCYFAYALGVGNFGRFLVASQKGKARII
jgi:hypothetical protein